MRAIVAETGMEAWASRSWHASATSWVDEQLERHAITRTGKLEQQTLRPWATVLSARTTHGRVWLKATGPGTSFEPALYELLGRAIPERVLAPIATDETRGWLLLPDGGPPLADRLAGAELAEALATILRCYAELQRAFAPHLDAALDAGVADMRPEIMPTRFEEAVETIGRLTAVRRNAGDREAVREVTTLRDSYRSWCERLAAAPGEASLDHNDLHPWNMLVPGARPARRGALLRLGRRRDRASLRLHARPSRLGAAPPRDQP